MTTDPVETFLGTLVVNRRSRYSYATPLRSFAALATLGVLPSASGESHRGLTDEPRSI